MARQKGSANFAGTLEVLAGGPIDARSIVPTLADLTVASNFPYPYVGMKTYVVAENKEYRLIVADVTSSSNWEEIGSGGGGGDGGKILTGTLLSSGWSNKTQTVSVTGLKSDTVGAIGVLNTATAAQIEAAREAIITPTTLANGSVTFTCENVPSINIPFGILIPGGGSGTSGSGIPDGGTTGQLLAKKSNTDGDAEWVNPISVDSAFSNTSENPLQNKVITTEFNRKADASALNSKADLVDGKVPANQLPSYVDDVIEGYARDDGMLASDIITKLNQVANTTVSYTGTASSKYSSFVANKSKNGSTPVYHFYGLYVNPGEERGNFIVNGTATAPVFDNDAAGNFLWACVDDVPIYCSGGTFSAFGRMGGSDNLASAEDGLFYAGKVKTDNFSGTVTELEVAHYYSFFSNAQMTQAITPEDGKIYIDIPSGRTFRWSGSDYVVIGSDLALGETSSTAYRGDRGKVAYETALENAENIGDLENLTTTAKTDLVSAINEAAASSASYTAGDGIDISNDEISIDPMPATDMEEIMTPLPSVMPRHFGPGGGFAPVGTVISFMGVNPPQDYLACDGTVYNIANYPQLAKFFEDQFGSKNYFGGNGTTTFAVPDLRGEFLRGTGTNGHTNQGNGRSVGYHQDATEIPFISVDDGGVGVRKSSTATMAGNYDSITKNSEKYANIAYRDSGTYVGFSLGTVKPTNTSILWCIKAIEDGEKYSTTERKVGTWIDGSCIYQRCFVLANSIELLPDQWFAISEVTLSNARNFKTRLYYNTLGGNEFAIDSKIQDNHPYIRYVGSTSGLTITNAVLICQYIKTTD